MAVPHEAIAIAHGILIYIDRMMRIRSDNGTYVPQPVSMLRMLQRRLLLPRRARFPRPPQIFRVPTATSNLLRAKTFIHSF